MQGFHLYLEKEITIGQLKDCMHKLFPGLTFYQWELQENITNGVKNRELYEKDILIEYKSMTGIFKTLVIFYRFPGEESGSRLNLYVGLKLSEYFKCKVTIDGYSYCDFDQMPDYSLLLENGNAFLIPDCYPDPGWSKNDERISNLKIEILQHVDISKFIDTYNTEAIKQ